MRALVLNTLATTIFLAMFGMMKALENAIERVKLLPEERQAYAAHVLEQIAADNGTPFQVPAGHRVAILEGLAQAERREFASEDAVNAILRKPWA